MNILDIAENSLAAGARNISILLEYQDCDRLHVVISDDGKGMDQETVSMVTNPFYTSRTTRNVGLGIPLLKMAAELTGGSLTIESKLHEGTVLTVEFCNSSIDMMPLGDMGQTMSALVSGHEEVNFSYCLTNEQRSFEMTTAQLKEILVDLPITTPAVAVFIRDYVNEHTQYVLAGQEI
ncbi:MAG: ATP-binding protein [Oscillospiraceae bacterium]|nr:ATP-binding protein [Oscillospiraceae bacterium]